mgnify:CR=1 FL=1
MTRSDQFLLLIEGFKLGKFASPNLVSPKDPKPPAPPRKSPSRSKIDKVSEDSWEETFTQKSFDNCRKFFHEKVTPSMIVGRRSSVQVVALELSVGVWELYLEVKFKTGDFTLPPGFVAHWDHRSSFLDIERSAKLIIKDAKQKKGLEEFDFDRWEPSIRRW